MFWKFARPPRHTAAWRISLTATFVFAMGTAVALFVSYLMVANLIREQGDTWLYGESQVLEDVAENSGDGEEAALKITEAARLALQEVDLGPETEESRTEDKPIFFLLTSPQDQPIVWTGPGEVEVFHRALHRADIQVDEAGPVEVPGWPSVFRVVTRRSMDGGEVFLGLSDVKASVLLGRVTSSFIQVWAGMILFGFAFCWLSARTILCRVERITATASEIGSHDFHRRVPQREGKDEISRLAATFNAMLDRIQASVEQLRTVTEAIAHDLRSPVTVIRGKLEMALGKGNPVNLRAGIADAIEGLDQLLRLLSSTLDVAESEAGALRLNRRSINMGDLAQEMVSLYQPAAEEQGLLLATAIHDRPTLRADQDLLRRALGNLLDNAIQHVPAGSTIKVVVQERDEEILLSVVDDGPGFAPGLAAKAFQRFVKGPTSHGHGIGLALVRAVARAHGGEATIQRPAGGGGASIQISLPISLAPAAALSAPS